MARGSQEAGFTQFSLHLFLHVCTGQDFKVLKWLKDFQQIFPKIAVRHTAIFGKIGRKSLNHVRTIKSYQVHYTVNMHRTLLVYLALSASR